jgi:hypothetical protein
VGGACNANGGKEECVLVIGRKARGKRPLGRLRRRWMDNIKTNLLQIEVTTKTAFFWNVTPCGSCKNRRFGGSYKNNMV